MKRLNLGCGRDIKEGWMNLDFYKYDGVDIVFDLDKLPLPFVDNSFDYILCKDVLEHVNFLPLINEIYRILKIGGFLEIRVPHFTSNLNYEDPTHQHIFSINTFDYFIEDSQFKYNRNIQYFSEIIKKKIIFNKSQKYFKLIYRFLEQCVNKSDKNRYFYENSFLRIFPAMNIEIIIKK